MTKFKYKVGDILCSLPRSTFQVTMRSQVAIIKELEDDRVFIDSVVFWINREINHPDDKPVIETVWYHKGDFLEEFELFHKMTPEEYRKTIKFVFGEQE